MTDRKPGFAPPQPQDPYPVPNPTYALPTRRRVWLPWVIAASVVIVVVAMIALVIGVGTVIAARFETSGDPLITGKPGPATASVPLECADQCFTAEVIAQTQPTQERLDDLGLTTVSFPWGTYDPTTAGALHRANVPGWVNANGYPDSCFFVPGNSPGRFDDSDESTDEIQWTGTVTNGKQSNTLDQSIRFFPDSASAVAYMEELAGLIAECQVVSIGTGADLYSAIVTPAPGLDLPDSVAATGWVRTGDPGPRWRAYVFDLQRGNLVVRTRLLTDGSLGEAEFRTLVESIAVQINSLEPIQP